MKFIDLTSDLVFLNKGDITIDIVRFIKLGDSYGLRATICDAIQSGANPDHLKKYIENLIIGLGRYDTRGDVGNPEVFVIIETPEKIYEVDMSAFEVILNELINDAQEAGQFVI